MNKSFVEVMEEFHLTFIIQSKQTDSEYPDSTFVSKSDEFYSAQSFIDAIAREAGSFVDSKSKLEFMEWAAQVGQFKAPVYMPLTHFIEVIESVRLTQIDRWEISFKRL